MYTAASPFGTMMEDSTLGRIPKALADRVRLDSEQPYAFTLRSAAVIATGGTGSVSINTDPGYWFLWTSVCSEVRNNADVSSVARAGSPFPRDPYSLSATNLPSIGTVTADLRIGDRQWYSRATPLSLITGPGDRPFYLPSRPIISPGTTIAIQFANASGIGVDVDFVLHGIRWMQK
jgi:hypothetical protein